MIFQHRLQIIAVVDIICVPEYLNQDYLVNLACDGVLETRAMDKIQISNQSCQKIVFFGNAHFQRQRNLLVNFNDDV